MTSNEVKERKRVNRQTNKWTNKNKQDGNNCIIKCITKCNIDRNLLIVMLCDVLFAKTPGSTNKSALSCMWCNFHEDRICHNKYFLYYVIDVIEVYERVINAVAQDISWGIAVHCWNPVMFRLVMNVYLIARE
jgi:hypothetical protein